MGTPRIVDPAVMREVRDGAKTTSGGSSDSELNDWQVKPSGPSTVSAVTTVTPEAKWPRTSRMTPGSTGAGSCAAAVTRESLPPVSGPPPPGGRSGRRRGTASWAGRAPPPAR